jgi:hypothetical protein
VRIVSRDVQEHPDSPQALDLGKAIDIGVSQSVFPSLMLGGDDARLIGTTARENSLGDAGKFVGECDRQQVAVEPLRCLLDPGP